MQTAKETCQIVVTAVLTKKMTHTRTKSDSQTELIRLFITPRGLKIKTEVHESFHRNITYILLLRNCVRGIEHASAGHKFKLPAECNEQRRDGESSTRTPPFVSATTRQQRHLQAKSLQRRMVNNNNNNETCSGNVKNNVLLFCPLVHSVKVN